MLGGKYRDRIRIYCDTSESPDPKVFAEQVKTRIQVDGFTWFKLDIGIQRLNGIPGTISQPLGSDLDQVLQPAPGRGGAAVGGGRGAAGTPAGGGAGAQGQPSRGMRGQRREHTFTGVELTDKGVALMQEHLLQVREVIGYDIPLSTDHFGSMGMKSIIKLGKAFEKANLAWMEDTVPWYRTELLKEIHDAIGVPLCTGEDIYLKAPFEVLCKEHAVDIIQPDLSTAGGILETKRIVDMAQEYGVPTAFHCAATPVCTMANIHCAAASEGFMVLECHGVDVPWWDSLVDGVEKPLIKKGFIRVPDGPGLGIRLNETAVKEHMDKAVGYFEPTPEWDNERSSDNIYS